MKTLIHRYRNLKLQNKLLLTYLLIISIPMLIISLFFYEKVYDMIVADTIRKEQADSSKVAPAITTLLSDMIGDSTKIMELPEMQTLLGTSGASRLIDYMDSADDDFSASINDILDSSSINAVKVYTSLPGKDMQALIDIPGDIFHSLDEIGSTYWKGIFAGTGSTSLHCPTFYLGSKEIKEYGDLAYILKRSIHHENGTSVCYVAFYYSSESINHVLRNTMSKTNSVAYIINDRDAIITTTNSALSSTYYLNYKTIQDSFMSSNNFLEKKVLGEQIYAGMYNIQPTQWYMVVVIPQKLLIDSSNLLMVQYFSLFLASILLAIVAAFMISRSITVRLKTVTKQMAKVRTGPPVPLKEPKVHDEIGELIDTYNYMSKEMNTLLLDRVKSAEELRKAEFNSLQAQINPHFLYNTMDMINWLAKLGKTDEISLAITDLSKFYKLTLSKKDVLSTISREIEHAKTYVRLQNMRFQNNIDFVVDISDEMMEAQIPKLTLQPVIENAIIHGIMEKESKSGTIVLTGWITDSTIELQISDDGIGIEESVLPGILDGHSMTKAGSNIGIYNTHHRIQLLYGADYGLTYTSVIGKGTDVFIRLPQRPEPTLLAQFYGIKE